jgi:hypothetical protein
MSGMAGSSASVRVPRWSGFALVAVAAAAVLVGILGYAGQLPEGARIPLLVAGYLLGAVGVTALAATHRALINGRRKHPRFRPSPALDRVARAGLWVGLAAGLGDAFLLATELAK